MEARLQTALGTREGGLGPYKLYRRSWGAKGFKENTKKNLIKKNHNQCHLILTDLFVPCAKHCFNNLLFFFPDCHPIDIIAKDHAAEERLKVKH